MHSLYVFVFILYIPTHTHTHTHTCIYIYAFPRGLSTLKKEFTAATCIMQSSLNELSNLESGKAKIKKKTNATT